MSDALATLSRAVSLLAQARSLDEVMRIRNMASAAKQYARAEKLGEEAIGYANEVKVRAARKAGELLRRAAEEGERERRGGDRAKSSATTLPDLGVSKDQSSRWQRIAAVPESEFEQAIAAQESESAIADRGRVRAGFQDAVAKHPKWAQAVEAGHYTEEQVMELQRDLDRAFPDDADEQARRVAIAVKSPIPPQPLQTVWDHTRAQVTQALRPWTQDRLTALADGDDVPPRLEAQARSMANRLIEIADAASRDARTRRAG